MPHTVLLIDDSDVDRATYQRFLHRDGRQSYELIEFGNGNEALDWCQNHEADIILLDYQLPDMDGLEFLRNLRQQRPNEILPVIMLTGLGNTTIAVEALKLGAQDYLEKSQVTQDSLPQLVRSVFQHIQLERKISRQQIQTQAVIELALQMRQSLEPQQVMDVTTQKSCQFLQADRVLVYQFAPDWSGLVASEAVKSGYLSVLGQQIQDTCFQQGSGVAYQQGQPWAMPDIEQANLTDCHRELLERFGVQANLVVPILQYEVPDQTAPTFKPALWGLLIVHHCSAPHKWQVEEISFLEQVAIHLSGAMQHASLYRQVEIELADRKRMQLALQQSEENLRLLIKYSPVSLAMFDREMCYIMASQRWVDAHQISSIEACLGRSHYEIYPEIPEKWRQMHQRCLAGATEKCDEDVFIKVGAPERWVSWETRPWYNAETKIGGIVICSEDITSRKQAEIALAASEARLRLAQSASDSGVWDWNLVTNTLIWSPEYYELYRLDPGIEPNYETWLSCIHPDDRDQVSQQTLKALNDESCELRVEFRVIRSDAIRWFAGIGQIFRNELAEPIRCIGITLDITLQKQAEIALQASNEQLQTINQDLGRANQAKDAFLHMMSHELRTPLNPILGMAEILQEEVYGSLNDRQQQAVRTIDKNGQHLLSLINNILQLVDLEASTIQLNRQAVLVKDLCQVSLQDVKFQAEAKSIQLQTQFAPGISIIQVDLNRMRQVLNLLLENAIKFTLERGKVVLGVQMSAICSSSHRPPALFMQFSIQDTGIGIAPEDLQHLFQFFTQVDDRLNRNYEGIGIGLALVQRLVELHGGNITVASQVGQGSCFTVNIPV